MSLLVDTSVWSSMLRRDVPAHTAEVRGLINAIQAGEDIYTTGLVLQELLQGFSGPKARDQILDRFSALPLLTPDRDDHIRAAEVQNRCRRAGVQAGTIDALLTQLCLRYDLTLLAEDNDFVQIARIVPLKLWRR